MSRHQRLQRKLRSSLRHPKLRSNRTARVYRQNKAFLDALDRGWLPGELDFGAPAEQDIARAREVAAELESRLKARGLCTAAPSR